MYYIVCTSLEERGQLIDALKSAGIMAVFHYLSLHKSPYYQGKHDGRVLPNTDYFSDCLLRLPMFYELSEGEQQRITEVILNFYAHY
jgi:dTDP-4-amino-4,6-dideoxygalactose transaminase